MKIILMTNYFVNHGQSTEAVDLGNVELIGIAVKGKRADMSIDPCSELVKEQDFEQNSVLLHTNYSV